MRVKAMAKVSDWTADMGPPANIKRPTAPLPPACANSIRRLRRSSGCALVKRRRSKRHQDSGVIGSRMAGPSIRETFSKGTYRMNDFFLRGPKNKGRRHDVATDKSVMGFDPGKSE